MLTYRHDARPEAATIAALYRAAPLYRPVDDVPRIAATYAGSNVVITAWNDDRLVGILRGWTDGAYDGYVCDLAVLPELQGQGVGRALLDECRTTWVNVTWVLRASTVALEYYQHLGWSAIDNGWMLPRPDWPGMPGR